MSLIWGYLVRNFLWPQMGICPFGGKYRVSFTLQACSNRTSCTCALEVVKELLLISSRSQLDVYFTIAPHKYQTLLAFEKKKCLALPRNFLYFTHQRASHFHPMPNPAFRRFTAAQQCLQLLQNSSGLNDSYLSSKILWNLCKDIIVWCVYVHVW